MIGFGSFYEAVRGNAPYPWQIRLAERCAAGDAPSWVVAPTGSGKTVTVDALVWALAMQADRPPFQRTASLRIVWAIDRRILVDQVFEQATELAGRLEAACDDASDVLHTMARRLLGLAAAGEKVEGLDRGERRRRDLAPLAVTRWRGGLSERATLRMPGQPQVITSTVGQIGSRLLFRGYGVGEKSLAINAGLAACDTTVCLDEAHLAEPFRQTVAAIRRRRAREREYLALPDLRLVTLTATPPDDDDLSDAVMLEPEDHERLGRRWSGAKTLELRDAAEKADSQLADAVGELVGRGHRTVACVVNSVLAARLVADRLDKTFADEAAVMLLIGPQRPADRARQLDEHGTTLFGGGAPTRPLVVVATQTFEVGLDAHVSGMVTQSASASALVQRLGRLNRLGNDTGEAIVIRDTGSWLYTEDEPRAWAWLERKRDAHGRVDVSVKALAGDDARPVNSTTAKAATLTDAIVRQLAQTSPRPAPYAEPDVEVLISGIGERPATDLSLVWRCDLRLGARPEVGRPYREALLRLAPPHPEEMLTLGIGAARKLLRARLHGVQALRATLNEVDVEGGLATAEPDPTLPSGEQAAFVVLRGGDLLNGVSGRAGSDDVTLAGLRPGDVILLGCETGGADHRGLAPASAYAHDVSVVSGSAPLRLSLDVFHAARIQAAPQPVGSAPASVDERRWRRLERRLLLLDELGEDALPGEEIVTRLRLASSESPLERSLREHLGSPDTMWRLRRVDPASTEGVHEAELAAARAEESEEEAGEPDTDELDADDANNGERTHSRETPAWVIVPIPPSRKGRDERAARTEPPTLAQHAGTVARRAGALANAAGIEGRARQSLLLAAASHDHGKADPRIQAWFAEGVARVGVTPIAKSTFGTDDRRTDRRARALAGMPTNLRHEIASVAILTDALDSGRIPAETSEADRDLALHLVATHHGRGRPVPPVPSSEGRAPEPFVVDVLGVHGAAAGDGVDGWDAGAWFVRFFDLHERYGPWTLAYLEALLVMADRTVSSEGN